MQIQSELIESDYSKLRSYYIFRVRKIWVLFLLCGLFLAWQIFPRDYAQRGIPIWFALVFSLVIPVILSVLIYLGAMILMALLPNRPGSILGAHTFTLTDSKFQQVNET